MIDRFPAANRHPAPLQTNQVLETESKPIHSNQYFPAQLPKRVSDLWVIESHAGGLHENRGRYDRSRPRDPSDVTDEEWSLVALLIPPARRAAASAN